VKGLGIERRPAERSKSAGSYCKVNTKEISKRLRSGCKATEGDCKLIARPVAKRLQVNWKAIAESDCREIAKGKAIGCVRGGERRAGVEREKRKKEEEVGREKNDEREEWEEKSRERCKRDGVRGEEKGVQVGEGEGDKVKFRWEGGALREGEAVR
jgi:ATP-dependent helicase YprA (DUF1998 family)